MIMADNPTGILITSLARHVQRSNHFTTTQVYEWVLEDYPEEKDWLSKITLGRLLTKLHFPKSSLNGHSRYFISPSRPELQRAKSDLIL